MIYILPISSVTLIISRGIDSPRQRDRLGQPLPSPRVISNRVHRVDGTSPRNADRTMMVMQWGQFLDHDIVETPELEGNILLILSFEV